jgi:hypothetical protein
MHRRAAEHSLDSICRLAIRIEHQLSPYRLFPISPAHIAVRRS